MPDDNRPSWLSEPCPHWCARTHAESDPPADRSHLSEPIELATLERATSPSADVLASRVSATTVQIGLVRVVGERETWVYLGDGETRGIELLDVSAWRLGDMLATLASGLFPCHSSPFCTAVKGEE